MRIPEVASGPSSSVSGVGKVGSASDQPPPGPDLAEGANGEPDAATNPAKDELLGQELDGEIEIDESDEEEGEADEVDGPRAGIDTSLPPLSNLDDIYSDLVTRANQGGWMDKLARNHKPRVATACSGLESPVLGLEQIQKVLKDLTGSNFEFEHVFAAEFAKPIQKYLVRNFPSTIVFTDVEELCYDIAPTATGKMVPVPQEIDIFIAGFPCVDFSGLNKHKKLLGDGGKSGEVFLAIWEYIQKVRPPLVILENVTGCEWDQVIARLERIGYEATYKPVDTKNYYLPQTRRRGYLIATPKSYTSLNLITRWKTEFTRLERPASCSIEALLSASPSNLDTTATKRVGHQTQMKWKAINEKARREERLGSGRVLTSGPEDDPTPSLVDATRQSNAWLASQTPRLIDVFNIHYLRQAKLGVDLSYKTRMLDIVQGVHFGQGSSHYGMSSCLTRTMSPFLTNLARPLTGRECLAVQGIPLDRVDLGDLSDAQLGQLAGNAMSTTVVAAAILAALRVGYPILPTRTADGSSSPPPSSGSATNTPVVGSGSFSYDDRSVRASAKEPFPDELLDLIESSARRCECEGTSHLATSAILKCTACGRTLCKKCKPLRGHSFAVDKRDRKDPNEAFEQISRQLPSRVKLVGFDAASLERGATLTSSLDLALLADYIQVVSSATDRVELQFASLVRGEWWVATYSAGRTRVQVTFGPAGVEWRLFVGAPAHLSSEHKLRVALASPVARMAVTDPSQDKSIAGGDWKLCFPLAEAKGEVELEHIGRTVPSWRATLQLPDFLKEKRNDQIKVRVPSSSQGLLDQDASGIYQLQPSCGTACASLYKRTSTPDSEVPPMFLFFDPTTDGPADLDSFVFSSGFSRLDYGQSREALCALESEWRPDGRIGTEEVQVRVASRWVTLAEAELRTGPVRVSDLITAGLVQPTAFTEMATSAPAPAAGPKKRAADAGVGPAKVKRRRIQTSSEPATVSSDESSPDTSDQSTVSGDSDSDDEPVSLGGSFGSRPRIDNWSLVISQVNCRALAVPKPKPVAKRPGTKPVVVSKGKIPRTIVPDSETTAETVSSDSAVSDSDDEGAVSEDAAPIVKRAKPVTPPSEPDSDGQDLDSDSVLEARRSSVDDMGSDTALAGKPSATSARSKGKGRAPGWGPASTSSGSQTASSVAAPPVNAKRKVKTSAPSASASKKRRLSAALSSGTDGSEVKIDEVDVPRRRVAEGMERRGRSKVVQMVDLTLSSDEEE